MWKAECEIPYFWGTEACCLSRSLDSAMLKSPITHTHTINIVQRNLLHQHMEYIYISWGHPLSHREPLKTKHGEVELHYYELKEQGFVHQDTNAPSII